MTHDGIREQTALADAVTALREEVARLAERISALETGGRAPAGDGAKAAAVEPVRASEAPPRPAPEAPAEISDDLVLVISAAIAAYLGKKPYIRQIRLVTSPTWTHQGRVSIQASHALSVRHRSGAAQ